MDPQHHCPAYSTYKQELGDKQRVVQGIGLSRSLQMFAFWASLNENCILRVTERIVEGNI